MKLTNTTANRIIGFLGQNIMPGESMSRPREKFVCLVDKTDEYGDIIRKPDGTAYQKEIILPGLQAQISLGMLKLEGDINLYDEYEEEKKPKKAEPVEEAVEEATEEVAEEAVEEAKPKRTRRKK